MHHTVHVLIYIFVLVEIQYDNKVGQLIILSQHLMKLPTIILGIPHLSLRIVKEKQQFTCPSSTSVSRSSVVIAVDVLLEDGLYRRTQDVKTAFWLESNAT